VLMSGPVVPAKAETYGKTTAVMNLRERPDGKSGRGAGREKRQNIRPSDSFVIKESYGKWIRVETVDGKKSGWIYDGKARSGRPYVKRTTPPQTAAAVKTRQEAPAAEATTYQVGKVKRVRRGSGLNVRTSPTSRSRRVGSLDYDEGNIEILGRARNGWWKIRIPESNQIGYVSENFLNVETRQRKVETPVVTTETPRPAAATPPRRARFEGVTSDDLIARADGDIAQATTSAPAEEPAPSGNMTPASAVTEAVEPPGKEDDTPIVAEVPNFDETPATQEQPEVAEDQAEAEDENQLQPAGDTERVGRFAGVTSDDLEGKYCTDCEEGAAKDPKRDLMEIPEEVIAWHRKHTPNDDGGVAGRIKAKNGAVFPLPQCMGVRHDGAGHGAWHARRAGGRYRHTGIDWYAPVGTPLYSPWEGKVISSTKGRKSGNTIRIRHSNGMVTVYMHMDSRKVRVGQKLKAGQMIGTVGKTGNAAGSSVHPHVHFELKDRRGRRLNPGAHFGCTQAR